MAPTAASSPTGTGTPLRLLRSSVTQQMGAATLRDGATGASADGLHGGTDEGFGTCCRNPISVLGTFENIRIITACFISIATTNL